MDFDLGFVEEAPYRRRRHAMKPQEPGVYDDCGKPRSMWTRLSEIWFSPKCFESSALYEHFGVRFVKTYVPTGGDFFIRRYGIRIIEVRRDLDALKSFERRTRLYEAIHEIAFVGFVSFSLWRAFTRRTSVLDFWVALTVYVVLILSPAMLQRYNRLRIHAVFKRFAASSACHDH